MNLVNQIIACTPRWSDFEQTVLLSVVAIVLTGFLVLLAYRRISYVQAFAGMLLIVWIIYVFGSTVFARTAGKREYNFVLFSSWVDGFRLLINTSKPWDKRISQINEIVLNMFLLFPVGALLPAAFNRKMKPVQGAIVGLLMSMTIEVMQLISRRGYCEVDDLFGNTIGCIAGIVIGSWFIERYILTKIATESGSA